MKYKIISTDNYLLVVSDDEIKKDEYYVSWQDYYSPPKHVLYVLSSGLNGNNPKKVIAHLPLNGAPYLDGVDVLPEIEDEVEKLAEKYEKEKYDGDLEHHPIAIYSDGYNKAKETYKYTEEDLKNVLKQMYSLFMSSDLKSKMEVLKKEKDISDKIIQSLQQPKLPIAFECEEEVYMYSVNGDIIKPKTITNLQGRTEWVGKYLF